MTFDESYVLQVNMFTTFCIANIFLINKSFQQHSTQDNVKNHNNNERDFSNNEDRVFNSKEFKTYNDLKSP